MITTKIKTGLTKAADKIVEAEYSLISKAVMKKDEVETTTKKRFNDNRGMAVVEIVLIIAVTVGVMYIFKEQITTIVKNIFTSAGEKTSDFMSE